MTATIIHGDCLDVLRGMADASVDAVVTDPPYELAFMGRKWDASGIAYNVDLWREVLRVLKPGGHLLAFGGTRTYHRMTCAIEDAGFEVRDSINWTYGSGFPKSLNASRAVRESGYACCCNDRSSVLGVSAPIHDVPANPSQDEEPDVLAPVQRQGARAGVRDARVQGAGGVGTDCGGLAQDGDDRAAEPCMEGRRNDVQETRSVRGRSVRPLSAGTSADGAEGRLCDGASPRDGADGRSTADANRGRASRRSQSAEQRAGKPATMAGQPLAQTGGAWPACDRCGKPVVAEGLGTALKPAHEPIVVARKPLVGTVAANVAQHGTGAINVDGCRVAANESTVRPNGPIGYHGGGSGGTGGSDAGRWPPNLLLTHSADCGDSCADDCPVAMMDRQSGSARSAYPNNPQAAANYAGADVVPGIFGGNKAGASYSDSGGASRFFPTFDADPFLYQAKASKRDRGDGNRHPTVKPTALMQWLVRLVTPPDGTILDPFAGSGTTLVAALAEGRQAIGIEREAEYVEIIKARLAKAEAA